MATFIKDISQVGISKILIIASGILTSVIVARTLGPEKNGIIASLLVYPSMFLIFGSLGISNATTYFIGRGLIPEKEIKKAVGYIWCFTSAFCVVCSLFLVYNFSGVGNDWLLIVLAISPIPFTLMNTYNSGLFLGKNELNSFNRISWIPYTITTVLALLLLFFLDMGIRGALLALLGGPVFIFSALLYRNNIFIYLRGSINWSVIKTMLQLGSIYAISLAIVKLHYQIDIIILNQLSTSYEVGIYTKGAVITEYLWQIPMLFNSIIFSRSANSKNQKEFSKKVVQLLRISLVIIGAAGVVLELLSKFIVRLFYGNAFIDSASVLMIMVPGVLLLTFYKILNTDLHGRGRLV